MNVRQTGLVMLSASAALAAAAVAQPVSTDLGTLTRPQIVMDTADYVPNQIRWYKFTLASGVANPSSFLDIRTTSPLVPAVSLDTLIGLYDATGGRIATDDQSGPSSFSALSFGATCALRPNVAPPLSAGNDGDGRSGSTLPAGVYYLAVTGFSASFGASGWAVTTSNTLTGSVTTEINFGTAAPAPAVVTSAAVAPSPVTAGQAVLITASLQTNCPSGLAGATMTVDLSSIGGPAAATMYDDGTHGDVSANNSVWSLSYVVPASTVAGAYMLTATSNNTNGLPDSRTMSVNVIGGPSVLMAAGGVYSEVEDNDTKVRANIILSMADNESITGSTTGVSTTAPGPGSADYFRVATATAPLGIYRHQLSLTGTNGVFATTIRGRNQTVAGIGTTDLAVQTATATPRVNPWYGFGKGESIYYRVTGTASTVTPYTATLTSTMITPVNLGTFMPGSIKISTVAQSVADTDLWVYDGGLNALANAGNDQEPSPGVSDQSILTRTYVPGVYYIALSDWNLANDQASPSEDRFRSGSVMDFADSVCNSMDTTGVGLGFSLTDSSNVAHPFPATKPSAYGVYWGTFTVTSPCGSSDFDGDGDSGTDFDIEAFFRCLGGDCCPTCGSSDFNNDGDSGTDADIEAFFRVLGGGTC